MFSIITLRRDKHIKFTNEIHKHNIIYYVSMVKEYK